MKLSGELDYRIRYDVEHDLFHAQNVFNDEYITPTFVEYVQELEKENAELKEYNKYLKRQRQGGIQKQYNKVSIIKQQEKQLTKAKELIEDLIKFQPYINREAMFISLGNEWKTAIYKAKQFLKEIE